MVSLQKQPACTSDDGLSRAAENNIYSRTPAGYWEPVLNSRTSIAELLQQSFYIRTSAAELLQQNFYSRASTAELLQQNSYSVTELLLCSLYSRRLRASQRLQQKAACSVASTAEGCVLRNVYSRRLRAP
jgi:hypothetical protein